MKTRAAHRPPRDLLAVEVTTTPSSYTLRLWYFGIQQSKGIHQIGYATHP